MKKLLVTFVLVIVLLTTCLVGCGTNSGSQVDNSGDDETLQSSAAAIFTIDVNPGLRVYVKDDNTVLAIEATNEDGQALVVELDVEGMDYETVVEEIIALLNAKGYLEGTENTVLISIEKKTVEILDKVNETVNCAFEKHGKKAAIIEQNIDTLDEESCKNIEEISQKHNISKGKARLVEKIREEFPELSEEELAKLKVNDLGVMLEETSDAVKEQFKKIDKAVEENYIGKESALSAALESLTIAAEEIDMQCVRATKGEDGMVYEVKFVYNDMEYVVVIDAENGAVLSSESKAFEEFNAKDIIHEFCEKNEIDVDHFKDEIKDKFSHKNEQKTEHNTEEKDDDKHNHPENDCEEDQTEEKILTRGELLKIILPQLDISDENIKRTDVKLHKSESGTVYAVTIETKKGDVYKLAAEAYTGTIIRVELNGKVIELSEQVEA